MKLYMVLVVNKRQRISINGMDIGEINMSFADGMKGVIPVFEDYKSAEKFAAKDKNEILELEI